MEHNNEMNMDQWVSNHLAELDPAGEWQPNVAQALALFKERNERARGRATKLVWSAAALAVACTLLLAFPKPRVLAERCVAACQDILSNGSKGVSVSDMAPDFSLKDAEGGDIRLSDYKGKVVLLNFWATWCPPCKAEIPWFTEFETAYGDRGFSVIGVSMDADGWKVVRPFMDSLQMNYSVGVGDEELARLYGANSFPMTLLIDRDGRIVAKHLGIVSKTDYKNEIAQLLGK
jgi:peroxiredoxin